MSLVIVNLLGIPKTLFISLNFVSIGLLIIYFLTIYVLVLLNLLRRISKCCLRPLYDEYGNVYIVVDMELKGLIREALIKMILGFDIALEIEEE